MKLLLFFFALAWSANALSLYPDHVECFNNVAYSRLMDNNVYVYMRKQEIAADNLNNIKNAVTVINQKFTQWGSKVGYDYKLNLVLTDKEPSGQKHVITIDADDTHNGCWARSNCDSGIIRTELHLPTWCTQDSSGTIHELMHALGGPHELDRPDSDPMINKKDPVTPNHDILPATRFFDVDSRSLYGNFDVLRTGYQKYDKTVLSYGDVYGFVKTYSKKPWSPNNHWYTKSEVDAHILHYRAIPGSDIKQYDNFSMTQCSNTCFKDHQTRLWDYTNWKRCTCKSMQKGSDTGISFLGTDRAVYEKYLPGTIPGEVTKTVDNVYNKEFCTDMCRAMGVECHASVFNESTHQCLVKSFMFRRDTVIGYRYKNDNIAAVLINSNHPDDDVPRVPERIRKSKVHFVVHHPNGF